MFKLSFLLMLSGCLAPVEAVWLAGDTGDSNSDSGTDTDTGPIFTDNDLDGHSVEDGDCDDSNPNVHPGATEVCNGVDDNCDTQVDEGVQATFFEDVDNDTYGNAAVTQAACTVPVGFTNRAGDCLDSDADYHPGASEVCGDLVDYNCDGSIGNDDADNDGVIACLDCDDSNPNVHPGAIEVCDSENLDEDCNGLADDADLGVDTSTRSTFYTDVDGDQFGVDGLTVELCDITSTLAVVGGDCDDGNAQANPNGTETCVTAFDDDCDGSLDNGADTQSWYRDQDGDTFGTPLDTVSACSPPTGYIADNTDCDDGNVDANPDGVEVCGDVVDQDCSGSYDDRDADIDGYVDDVCTVDGIVAGDDCDDGNIEVNPGAIENSVTVWDDDCDGFAHDDGTLYGSNQGDVQFTGPNLLASADSTFEGWSSSSTSWSVHTSALGSVTDDISSQSISWSDGWLDGTRSSLVFPDATVSLFVRDECIAVGVSGLTTGAQYAVALMIQNPSVDSQGIWLLTEAQYDCNCGTNLDASGILPGSEKHLVGGFIATRSTDKIVMCYGNWKSEAPITHVWVGEATF